ncbi:MAG: F0F1 ATP synthase subunit delta [Pseudomonadales bacterium]|nr:F0F1 ATP synthase subunit delta [Pseudomonadales bacterium]
MAESITLARPYAKAAFEVALAAGDLDSWSRMLGLLASLAQDEKVHRVLSSPAMSAEKQAKTLVGLCDSELTPQGINLVQLLAENRRLPLLPEIARLFNALKANQEKTVDVELSTAFALGDDTVKKLTEALQKRLSRQINLQTTVDKHLIGGAIIRAGDTVIDSSVRGKLTKLAEAMNS